MHGHLVAPLSRSRARPPPISSGRLPRGGAIREPPALVDRLPDRALAQRSPLRRGGARLAPGEALLGLQQPTHHQQLAHQVIECLAGGSPWSGLLSAVVDTTWACALLTG